MTTYDTRRTANRQKIRSYILDAINSEAYEVKAETDKEKLEFLVKTFNKEYVYPENLHRYGSYQNIFVNWIMGLPSSFNVDFENYRILELGKEWGYLNSQPTEAQEDKWLEMYWNKLYMELLALLRKHKLSIV